MNVFKDYFEETPMMTRDSMLDHITDYANEFGDQATLKLFRHWMRVKMGKVDPNPTKLLIDITHKLHDLDNGKKSLNYIMAITDSMLVVMKELIKL